MTASTRRRPGTIPSSERSSNCQRGKRKNRPSCTASSSPLLASFMATGRVLEINCPATSELTESLRITARFASTRAVFRKCNRMSSLCRSSRTFGMPRSASRIDSRITVNGISPRSARNSLASPMLCGIFGTPSRTRVGGAFSLAGPPATATTLALAFRVFVALVARVLFTRIVYHTRKVRKGFGSGRTISIFGSDVDAAAHAYRP